MDEKGESSLPRPRGRPRKGSVHCRSLADLNNEAKSCSPRPIGRPRKTPVRTEPVETSNGELKSCPPRQSGKPRKRPVSIESFDDSNVKNKSSPPRRPRGRPRKRPVGIESSDDLNVKNKSSPPRRPRGRPRKKTDKTDNVDDVNAIKDLSITEFIPVPDVELGEGTSILLSVNEPIDSKRSLLIKYDVDENRNMETIGDFDVEDKQSPPRPRRGRPRKKLVRTESLDYINSAEVTSVSNFIPPSGVELGVDTSVPSTVSGLVRTTSDLYRGEKQSLPGRPIGRVRKRPGKTSADLNIENESSPQMRRRGRPRKGPVLSESLDELNCIAVPNVTKCVELENDASLLSSISGIVSNTSQNALLGRCDTDERFVTTSGITKCTQKRRMKAKARAVADKHNIHPISSTIEDLSIRDIQPLDKHVQDVMVLSQEVAQKRSLDLSMISSILQTDIALPRLVLCLGHNGKVAWDVKWRPSNNANSKFEQHMGYLAVLLGNGSLEVWEVPLPRIVKILHTSFHKEGTDPRFLKLDPVFRCSKVKCGERQSIPLTVEWSHSAPCDLILVGCHDGTVALWKFSAQDSSQDTKPLLCFTADSVPIRTVAWAPDGSDAESANLIVTAGHEGLKFWDIRDPYRPLWDFNPAQRNILSMDWLQDPSCLIFSLDDGTIKTISLLKAAYDVPVTGKVFTGAKHGVVHNYYRSQFAIWSVQVSPVTGVAAYCCADGSTLCFQITAKAVDKDKSRYGLPHFLCGSLMKVGQSLTINTPLPNTTVAELRRPLRGCTSDSNHAKKGNPQFSGDDYAIVLGSEHCHPAPSRKTTPRTTTSPKEKSTDQNQTMDLVCIDGAREQVNLNIGVNDTKPLDQSFLVLPPKIVAMHRVRWNTNRGSERWLCYGGAAGIVRCQVIALPTVL